MSVNSFALSTPQISTKPDNGTERGEVENVTLRRTLGWHFVHFNCERQLQFWRIENLRWAFYLQRQAVARQEAEEDSKPRKLRPQGMHTQAGFNFKFSKDCKCKRKKNTQHCTLCNAQAGNKVVGRNKADPPQRGCNQLYWACPSCKQPEKWWFEQEVVGK